jgi:acylphosphatase
VTAEPVAGATVRRRVVVEGLVQGVWYRDSLRAAAEARGVSGWVRNRRDGAVEAELEGPPAAVADLVEWCREGPPHARVTGVTTEPTTVRGERGFRVRAR